MAQCRKVTPLPAVSIACHRTVQHGCPCVALELITPKRGGLRQERRSHRRSFMLELNAIPVQPTKKLDVIALSGS